MSAKETMPLKLAFGGKTAQLQHLCSAITDCHHSTPNWLDSGHIVVRSENIKRGKISLQKVSYTDGATFQERIARSVPEAGDLIVTREAPMGEVGMIPDGVQCCLGQRLVLVKPDSSKINRHYLLYAMQSEFVQKQIGASDETGSTVSNLRIPALKELLIPLLDRAEEIGAILSALDAKIDLNNRINAELEALAKTIYDYWFVQFDFPDANGRPYKSSGGAMVWNDTLKREIPAGWEALPLSTWIAKQKNGEWGADSAAGSNDAQVTCLRGADINALNGRGELNAPTRYISPSKMERCLAAYDLVVEISGGSPTQSTGRVALVSPEVIQRFDVPLVCSNFCKALTLNDPAHSYYFLQQWNALYSAGVFFGWEGKTSGIKNLQFDAFVGDYHAPVPSEDLLHRFHELSGSLDMRKQNGLHENRELTQLRDWLLPLLMNGQVRVS